jgi:hypothetical protein
VGEVGYWGLDNGDKAVPIFVFRGSWEPGAGKWRGLGIAPGWFCRVVLAADKFIAAFAIPVAVIGGLVAPGVEVGD